MRISYTAVLAATVSALIFPGALQAQDHGSVSFVTGYSMAQGSPVSNIVSAVSSGIGSNLNLGGRVAFGLTPNVQVIGEVGRIGNVLPPVVTSISALSPFDLRATAFYGEGGMRASLGGHSSVSPYVEATGGLARVNLRVSGLSGTAGDLLGLGLGLTNRTSPVAGVGGGVMFHAGRATFDAGYRFKKIFARDLVSSLFSSGDGLTSHQVMFGAGVRF